MKIAVRDVVSIDDVDNVRAFEVETDLASATVDAKLRESGLGYVAGGYAWITATTLADMAGVLSTDPSWRQGFDEMVAFAQSKGWWDESSQAIRAHLTTS